MLAVSPPTTGVLLMPFFSGFSCCYWIFPFHPRRLVSIHIRGAFLSAISLTLLFTGLCRLFSSSAFSCTSFNTFRRHWLTTTVIPVLLASCFIKFYTFIATATSIAVKSVLIRIILGDIEGLTFIGCRFEVIGIFNLNGFQNFKSPITSRYSIHSFKHLSTCIV